MSDKQLKRSIIELLECDEYKPNEYTSLVSNIIKFEEFSKKQRKVLILHLIDFED